MIDFNQLYKWVKIETGIDRQEIVSKTRKQKVVTARALFITMASKTGFSYSSIAKELKRDHTSILHLINTRSESEFINRVVGKYDLEIKKNYSNNEEKIKQQLRFRGLTNGKNSYKSVYEKYNGKCMVCSFDEVVEIHHIIPRYLGGSDELENLALLCPNHHALADRGAIQIKGKLELIHQEIGNPQG